MKDIDLAEHLSLLSMIEIRETLPAGTFEVVESVTDWCTQRGVPESHPDRMAKCLTEKGSGKPLILLKRRLSSTEIRGVLDYMHFRGYGDVAVAIRDESHFLQVLAYHEIAHLKLADPSEEDCDRWALSKSHA